MMIPSETECSDLLLLSCAQAVSQEVQEFPPRCSFGWRWRWRRSEEVQHEVVVLDARGPQDLEALPEEGQGVQVLEEAPLRTAQAREQGLQVVVVEQQGSEDVEEVQGEGQGVEVLEEAPLRLWTVCFWFVGMNSSLFLPIRFMSMLSFIHVS